MESVNIKVSGDSKQIKRFVSALREAGVSANIEKPRRGRPPTSKTKIRAGTSKIERINRQQLRELNDKILVLAKRYGLDKEGGDIDRKANIIIGRKLMNRLNVGKRKDTQASERVGKLSDIPSERFQFAMDYLESKDFRTKLEDELQARRKILKSAGGKEWRQLQQLIPITGKGYADLKPILQNLKDEGVIETRKNNEERGRPYEIHALG